MGSRLRAIVTATLLASAATTASAADPEWIKQFGTRREDVATGVAIGWDNRVHVVGRTEGHFGAYKGGTDAFVITFDRDGHELWRHQPGTTEYDRAQAVATDGDGNLYVVGDTQGALGGDYKGSYDIFVIKYDRDGRFLWKRQPGTSGDDYARGVATDADDNVYVVGYTQGAIGQTYKGIVDVFVIKFDRDGHYVWRRQPGTAGYDFGFGVAAGSDGGVNVVGQTTRSLDGPNHGSADAFVIKYDGDGRNVWRAQPGTKSTDSATSVAADADGNVYVAGSTFGAFVGASNGYIDAFLLKFDRDGDLLWKVQRGTVSGEEARGVATDANGNAYVVGEAGGAVAGASKGLGDAFVFKFDRDGLVVWSDQPGTSVYDDATAVTTDTDGNVYTVGYTFGSLPGNAILGVCDAFLIKYGPNGPQ